MAKAYSNHIGTLYANGTSSAYGIYDCYLEWDSTTRSGGTVYVNGMQIRMYRQTSGKYTTNRLAIYAAIGYGSNYIIENVTVNSSGTAAPREIIYSLGNPSYATTSNTVYIAGWCASTGKSKNWDNFQGNSPVSNGWYISCPAAAPEWSSNPSYGSVTDSSAIIYPGGATQSATAQYKLGGGSWTNFSGGSVSWTGLSPSTTYTASVRWTANGYYTSEKSVSFTTSAYPAVTSVSQGTLTAGNAQTIYLSNPHGRKVTVYMAYNSASTSTVLASGTTSSTSISLTPSVDTCARALGSYSSSGKAYYFCVYNGTQTGSVSGTYQITGGQVKPTWSVSANSAISCEETLSSIASKTSSLVQQWSKPRFKLNTAASPRYYSSISSYTMTITGLSSATSTNPTVNSWYSPAKTVGASVGSIQISVYATDSRGFRSDTLTKTIPVIAYFNPIVKITATRAGGYGEVVDVKLEPNWAIGSTNAGTISYQYSSNGGSSWSSETKATSNTFSVSGIDNDTVYLFRARATDALGKIGSWYQATVPIGQPIFMIDTQTVGAGVNCFPSFKGLEVDGLIKSSNGLKFRDRSDNIDLTFNDRPSEIYGTTRFDLLTSSTTIDSDPGDGFVQTCIWDNSGKYDTQFFLPNNAAGGSPRFRTRSNADSWGAWNPLAYFPIGAVYLSVNSTSPASLFGGSWTRIDGYYLYAGTGGKTAGSGTSGTPSTNVTSWTWLSASQSGLPSHQHWTGMTVPESYFWIRHGKSAGTDSVAGGHNTVIGEAWSSTIWNNGFSTESYQHRLDAVITYQGGVGISAWSNWIGGWDSSDGHRHDLQNHTHDIVPWRYEVYAWRRTG